MKSKEKKINREWPVVLKNDLMKFCVHFLIIMFYFLSDKEQIDNKNPSLAEDQVHQHLKD